MTWMVDGKVNLSAVCAAQHWHLGSAIAALVEAGLGRADAESFAEFAFTDYALAHGGRADCEPEEWLTPEQGGRLAAE